MTGPGARDSESTAPLNVPGPSSRTGSPVGAIALMALGYLAGARLGALLAIPPGYASAFWLPAGLGLMAVLARGTPLVVGVVLGAFLNNLIVTGVDAGAVTSTTVLVSAGIAAGAGLQALAGAGLVRRYVGYPTELTRVGEALKLYVLGGPFASLIAASIGTLVLTLSGTIPLVTAPFTWFNWWIGDSIGVLLVVPLWLVAVGEPRSFWRHRWRTVAAPVLVIVAAALAAFAVAQRFESAEIRAEFTDRAHRITRQLQAALEEDLVLLEAVRGHFEATPATDRGAFAALTRGAVARRPAIRAVGWAPRVAAAARAGLEREAARDGAPGFRITALGAGGATEPSPERPEYLPVLYLEPLAGNEASLGLDLGSEPGRRQAIEEAERSGAPAVTRPLRLAEGRADGVGVLALVPVHADVRGAAQPPGPPARGFVVGVIAVADLIAAGAEGIDLDGVGVRLVDDSDPGAPSVLYDAQDAGSGIGEINRGELRALDVATSLTVPGRHWRAEFHPTLRFLESARSTMPWIVQTAGLSFAGLIGILLLNLSGRNEEVLREVESRTRELSERNRDLGHEISERERVQAALSASERRYRTVIEHAPLMIAVARDGRHIYANSRYLEANGLGRLEDVIGTPLLDRVAPPAREAFLERSTRRQRGLPVERVNEVLCMRADGTGFPVIAYVDTIELEDGPAVIGFFEDLTERRAIEAARRESDERFAAAFENSANGIVIEDRAGRVQRVNPAMCALLGYTREELLERNLYDLTYPDDLAASAQSARGLWDGKIASYQLEKRYLHKDGQPVWVVIAAALIRDEQHRPTSLVVQVQDIRERKGLEAQLGQAQRLESLGRLAGGIAHDFNNLLTVINGRAAIVQRTLADSDPRREQLESLLRASHHAADLTRQLLAFGRRQLWQPRALRLSEFVAESEQLLRSLVREDITLTIRTGSENDAVMADPTQLQQVLVNLVGNAVDAMPEGGRLGIDVETATIAAPAEADASPGRYVVLAISDTGHGIEPALQRQIFEPFFTTKALGKGTGLGLATVYGIVRQAGGFVRFHSGVGAGTVFRVYLPQTEAEAASPEPITLSAIAGTGSETVLIVEDRDDVRALTLETVRSFGYDVLGAADGTEALAVSARTERTIHLLLTDVVMPGMNGRELAERIRAERPAIKVLFVSGYSAEVLGRRGIVDSGVNYLMKPFTAEELQEKIREAIDRDDTATRPA